MQKPRDNVGQVSYTWGVFEDVDWKHRADYMLLRHSITVDVANEALTDLDALVFNPDPTSTSGLSIRAIGYSRTATTIVTVIVVPNEDGGYWGVNGWESNSTERRLYHEGA